MFDTIVGWYNDIAADINWVWFGGPKPRYGCIQEVQMDMELKRELFLCIPRTEGFGKHIDDLSRPITIEEVGKIHEIVAEAQTNGRYAAGMSRRLE